MRAEIQSLSRVITQNIGTFSRKSTIILHVSDSNTLEWWKPEPGSPEFRPQALPTAGDRIDLRDS